MFIVGAMLAAGNPDVVSLSIVLADTSSFQNRWIHIGSRVQADWKYLYVSFPLDEIKFCDVEGFNLDLPDNNIRTHLSATMLSRHRHCS